jgi:hypothetical protein
MRFIMSETSRDAMHGVSTSFIEIDLLRETITVSILQPTLSTMQLSAQ